MERPEQLTQKKLKRRVLARDTAIDIVTENLNRLNADKAALNARKDATPLNEGEYKDMSLEQLDDYINAYSQVYAETVASADQLRMLIKDISKYKAVKMRSRDSR